MVSTKVGAENNDSEACDNIFQIGHLMSRNLVKQKFHNKDSKMLLTYYALIDHLKNKTRMTVFCKLAIFWAAVVLGSNFAERAPKCRCYDKQQNTS